MYQNKHEERFLLNETQNLYQKYILSKLIMVELGATQENLHLQLLFFFKYQIISFFSNIFKIHVILLHYK